MINQIVKSIPLEWFLGNRTVIDQDRKTIVRDDYPMRRYFFMYFRTLKITRKKNTNHSASVRLIDFDSENF